MTEPVYSYIKGEGWVIRNYPTRTGISYNGAFRITLTLRTPVAGEHFFNDEPDGSISLDAYLDGMLNSLCSWTNKPKGAEWDRLCFKYDKSRYNVVVECEDL